MREPVRIDEGRAYSGEVGIAWQRQGRGDPTVLFVPTWNLVDARVSRRQVSFLSSRATVITYDPRGAGSSDRPLSGYDFTDHMADALAVLEDTGTERAVVVTASRGINSAVLMAASHPERIQGLVGVAPYVEFDGDADETFWQELDSHEGWDKFNAAYWRRDFPDFVRFFMAEVFTEPDSAATIEEIVDIALEASPEMLIQQEREQDWSIAAPLLGSVACPTLLIHGDDDHLTPPAVAETIAAAIPDARLVVLAGAGHRPDVRDPELVNPLLGQFLDSLVG
jgi:pimeloyl-ACP methyl ester carboxylesterase